MYNFFLALYKHFSTNYLKVPEAGRALEAEKEKMKFSSRLDDVLISKSLTSSTVTPDPPVPSFSAPLPKAALKHSYSTQLVASNLHHQGSSSAESDGTIKGKQKASPTSSPSPPPPLPIPVTFGMASAGTLKADEWHSLFEVYILLAWVPHFLSEETGFTPAKILASLLQLIQIGNICTLNTFQQEDSKRIGTLVDAYQNLP
ncbi:hypothetical protein DFH28DRAFT_922923 [Melampsora americana]|nr:hypothetical protein DFH28DRAFT_922923 [Melampsora americana]